MSTITVKNFQFKTNLMSAFDEDFYVGRVAERIAIFFVTV